MQTRHLALGVVLVLSGCASSMPPAATAATPATAELDATAGAELAALVDRVNSAWAAGDLETIRSLLADEGFLTSFDVDMANKPITFRSKAEVLAFAEQVFAEMKKMGATMQFSKSPVDCRATATFGVCASELTATANMGGKVETMSFRLTAAGHKGPNGWLATHWHGSPATLPPPPAPAPAPAVAPGPTPAPETIALSAKDMKWVTPPDAPPGLKVAVVSGDPAKGAFSAMVEFPKGASFPRHYHGANTYAYLVKGSMKITMADGRVLDLKPGAAGLVPAKAIHTTESKGGAVVYQYSDGADTTVMVDEQGNPLPPPAPATAAPAAPAAPASK